MENAFFLAARNRMAADSARYVLETNGFAVAGIVRNATDALAWLQSRTPAVFMVGSELDDATGLDLMRMVHRDQPTVRRVLFVREAEVEYVKQALEEGVDGLLSADSLVSDLVECAGKVLAGHRYVYQPLQDILSRRFSVKAVLSARERNIFDFIGQGMSNAQIAEHLGIGIPTVYNYRTRIAEKLGLEHSKQLEHYILNKFSA